METSAQVVGTSVKATTNSSSQDYAHPDDHTSPTYEGFLRASKLLLLLAAGELGSEYLATFSFGTVRWKTLVTI